MTKERELLRRALEVLDEKVIGYEITKGAIRTYLSTPSDDADEPVAQVSTTNSSRAYVTAPNIPPGTLLYRHPPKPAEPEAETIETLKAENFKLASGQCTEGGPWGDKGGTPYCKYAARKPMTAKEMLKGIDADTYPYEEVLAFVTGIRYAEKHHGIGGGDE